MKKVLILVFAGVVIGFVLLGIQASIERAQTTVRTIDDYQADNGIPVTTARAAVMDMNAVISYTGTIKGIEQADATATVQIEKVQTIHVKPGDAVRKGQLLVTLDNKTTSTYRLVTNAEADAKKDLERTQELFKAGAVSKQMLDKAELGYNAAKAELDALIERHRVKSPISGTATDLFVETGQTVTAGMPLVRVARLEEVETEINVAETDIASVKNGQSAVISTRVFPGKEFAGKVNEVAYSTNQESRTFTVKLEIPNEDRMLRPGMFVDVDLVISSSQGAVSVPADAVVKDNGSYYVYMITSSSTVQKVAVSPGVSHAGWVEIPEGIESDAEVVVEGHNKLSDGVKVNVVS